MDRIVGRENAAGKVYGLIAAAGRSERFKQDSAVSKQDKIWADLAGKRVFEWSLEAFDKSDQIAAYIMVVRPDQLEFFGKELKRQNHQKLIELVPGGESRQESVYLGLEYLLKISDQPKSDLVVIHDGARPLLTKADLDHLIDKLKKECCGAGFCTPVTDTLRYFKPDDLVKSAVIPRQECFLMQTPQGAPLKILQLAAKVALEEGELYTDDLALLEAIGYPIRLIDGPDYNLKITKKADLGLAAYYLSLRGQNNQEPV